MIIIDIENGDVDKTITDPDVAVALNNEFLTVFLHPRARPWLTERFGWPSMTMVDDHGCIRAAGAPKNKAEADALIKEALEARAADRSVGLPDPKSQRMPPPGGGEWTQDHPKQSAVFAHPARGAPAVLWEGRPFVFGNRADAVLVAERPAAGLFLDSLPTGMPWPPTEGPIINCQK